MKIRPGRNLLRVAGGLLAASLLAFVWPQAVWLLLLIVAAAAGLAAFDYLRLQQCLDAVSIERALPNVVGRGVAFDVEYRVRNVSRDAQAGELRDVLPASAVPRFQTHPLRLLPNSGEVVNTTYVIPVRGRHEFGPLWVRLFGGWGMLDAQSSVQTCSSVKVLPEGYSSAEKLRQDELAATQLVDKLTRSRQLGVGTEFVALSEYRFGDDPRRIDWRATARARRPIVRRYQIERHRDVMIVLDCGRLMGAETGQGTKLDCAVDAALMLVRVVLRSGDRCGLGLFDDQVLGYLPPMSGAKSVSWIAESVYDVASRWRESDFGLMFATLQARQTKRSLVVVLSDIVDVETTRRFRASLASMAKRHVILFAALQTPLLRALVRSPVETVLDGSRQAVAFRILREREQAVHSLRRSGVHVLDVAPQELSVPLINQFIELRQRNLL